MLVFTATWCPPCQALHQPIDQLARENPSLKVVLLDVGETRSRVAATYDPASMPPNAVVLVDEPENVKYAWNIEGVPTVFLLDSDGVVRHIEQGFSSETVSNLRRALREMIGRSSP